MVIVARKKPRIRPLENSSAVRLTEGEARRLQEQISGMVIERVETESARSNPGNARNELSAAMRPYFGKPRNLVVWVTAKGEKGALYRSEHQLIGVYIAGSAPLTNKIRVGERGRQRTNVWTYPGYQQSGRRTTAISLDPRVKPVALVADALRDSSTRGQIVLDPFAGIGTTMIAAERTSRRARLIEIDPIFCDLIVRRWQKFSGQNAQLAGSNESFAEVQARRHRADASQE